MKIIFFGSSEFAVPALEALKDKEEVVLVVTQPDRKKGRSLKVGPTAVKGAADRLGIETFQPDTVNSRDSVEYLKGFGADLFIVVSFGQILEKRVIDIPRLYCLNAHASLLPKYRGAAPVNWAVANGERETGITVIRMNERMDEGDIIMKAPVSIAYEEDAVLLSKRLSEKSPSVLLDSIGAIKRNAVRFVKQDGALATYAPKLKKEDGLIDWDCEKEKIYNRIRAFVPWPGSFTYWNKNLLKIWKAVPVEGGFDISLRPGTVIEATKDRILIAAGKNGALDIKELQLEGSRRMKAGEFIAGRRDFTAGTVL